VWQFLISGYVPGTNFQVTFDTIETIFGILVVIFLLRVLTNRQKTFEREIMRTMSDIERFRRLSI
jgi:hypothetical protein